MCGAVISLFFQVTKCREFNFLTFMHAWELFSKKSAFLQGASGCVCNTVSEVSKFLLSFGRYLTYTFNQVLTKLFLFGCQT